jgi:hypothetical protein
LRRLSLLILLPGLAWAQPQQIMPLIGVGADTTQRQIEAMMADHKADVSAELSSGLAHLNELVTMRFAQQDEKLKSIQTQFDSAFASFEKAIDKSDQNTSGLITQLGSMVRTQKEAIDTALANLSSRITTIESRQLGESDAKNTMLDNAGLLIGLGGLALAAVAFFVRQRPREIRYINHGSAVPDTATE